MDLEFENYAKNAQFDFLKSQNELPGWSWDCGSTTARDKFPQEIWLKVFSYLKVLDLSNCAQVCKWMHGICLDTSLKYHEIQEIYQTSSTRFIKGGTFLYRRVNGVFNATIRWYSCSNVLCICYFNTYTENSPFLL